MNLMRRDFLKAVYNKVFLLSSLGVGAHYFLNKEHKYFVAKRIITSSLPTVYPVSSFTSQSFTNELEARAISRKYLNEGRLINREENEMSSSRKEIELVFDSIKSYKMWRKEMQSNKSVNELLLSRSKYNVNWLYEFRS